MNTMNPLHTTTKFNSLKELNNRKPSKVYNSFEESIQAKYINVINDENSFRNFSEQYRKMIKQQYAQHIAVKNRKAKENIIDNVIDYAYANTLFNSKITFLKEVYEDNYQGVKELLLKTVNKNLDYLQDKVSFITRMISYKTRHNISISKMLIDLKNKFAKFIYLDFKNFDDFIVKLEILYNKHFKAHTIFKTA